MKRGQAEIFGLIIIVIILIFALLFFVKTKQSDDSSVTLRNNFRANNLMNAIMDVTLDSDGNPSLKEKMKECIDNPTEEDNNGNIVRSEVCNLADTELKNIFDLVLLPSEKYEFFGARSLNDDPPMIDLAHKGACPEGITASPFSLPGNYVFQLKICS